MLDKIKYFIFSFLFSCGNLPTTKAQESIYDIEIYSISGEKIDLSKFQGKKILFVNVASKCGFTSQYTELEQLYQKYKDKLMVIGVPCNQFGSQEPGTNEEIKEFCEVNFNITFPMTVKADVKGDNAHEIYKWAFKNHGKSTIPKWNFHKILINPNGKIEDTFMSFTRPTSKKIINSIENLLN